MALPLTAILNVALGVGGILAGGRTPTPGGATAAKVSAFQNVLQIQNRNRAAIQLRNRVLDQLEALDRGESTTEQLELDIFGQTLAQQAVATLGRQEAGTAESITRRFSQRGLVGSGLEAAAQTQLAAQFGIERSRVVTKESFNRLTRRLEELRTRENQLAGLAGLPVAQLPVAQEQPPGPAGQIGGFLLQKGLQGLLTSALAPAATQPTLTSQSVGALGALGTVSPIGSLAGPLALGAAAGAGLQQIPGLPQFGQALQQGFAGIFGR